MNNTYVIDGSNVCWWYGQTHLDIASIQPLLTVLVALLENGDDFYCVFDASVTHTIGNNGNEAEAASIENLLRDHSERFYRVTGATRADGVILHDADHYNRSIITNDIYRDYKEKYEWLSDKYTKRLVQGNLQPSGLITLEKLPYGQLSLKIDTETSLNRLYELLAVRKAPAISELDRQLQHRQKNLAEIDKRLQEREAQLHLLMTQIGDLERKKKEFDDQTDERVSLRNEIDALKLKLNETREDLKVIYDVRDFDSIQNDMKEKLDKLRSDIILLEFNYSEKKKSFANIELESKQYMAAFDQKERANEGNKLDLSNDQACIRKAQIAIADFLEPYSGSDGLRRKRTFVRRTNGIEHEVSVPTDIEINFSGSSWDVAVKKLQIYFDQHKVCTHCYSSRYGYENEGVGCRSCQKGIMTVNPKDLWQIILNNAPQ